MKILLIEDDRRLARLIERVLRDEGHSVDVANDGDTGLELVLRGIYDLAVIDWMLPGKDGPALCRAMRSARLSLPILMLTARSQVEDRVVGLDSGADDYLTKPFAFTELTARIRALSRRINVGAPTADSHELRCGQLVMDMRARIVRRGEHTLTLTTTEWTMLEYLLRNAGQVLSRAQLLDYVWSYDRDVQPGLVDVYVSYLRRKLNQPGRPDPIQTVRGVGYRLEEQHA